MKTFSPHHQKYLQILFDRIQNYYSEHLIVLAVYGSYARGENRPDSDIDLFIVLEKLPEKGSLKKHEAFVREVELPLDPLWSICSKEGIRMEVSALILSREQAKAFLPLYLDMAEHCLILTDKDDFLRKKLDQVGQQMKRWGSQKREVGGHWYWEIRPGTRWDEVVDYDK
ncbi:MAG: nucleotidyltransferase domain-containing protein [Deltaproteobacteria bacterium]|nr:nucleotidyltransferase domain-containing protein [Deltaproteobacteria bacterium]